jgi:tRNA 2-thiouridine synthesizing protein A
MSEKDFSRIVVDETLDCRGQFCPMPILETKKKMKSMESGQILEILGTDSGTVRDLPAWCKRTGNEYLGYEEREGVYHFFVKKG